MLTTRTSGDSWTCYGGTAGYLSGPERDRAVELADEMKTWHIEQVDGESQLFDANGQAVDETEVKAQGEAESEQTDDAN